MTKNIIAFFLAHKSLNHLLFISLLLFSAFSYQKIAKEMFPPTTLDSIVISGSYRSASADILDQLIVCDCEKIMKENPYLANISSVIAKGKFHVSAELIGGSKELIISDITSAISSLGADLPEDMKIPTVTGMERFFPLLSLAIFPKEENTSNIVEISKKLKDEIGSLKHIYRSELVGKYDKSLHVILDTKKIEAHGLSQVKVKEALRGLYLMYPVGVINEKREKYFISTKSSNISHEDILNTSLSIGGRHICLKEIATVKTEYEKHSLLSRTDAKKSLMIMTKKAQKGDAIKLSGQIRQSVDKFQKRYPHLNFKVLGDSSFWIKTRLNVISANILIGLILLFFAIWIFISLRIAIVVIVGIPVSFAFGIIGLDVTDASLNTLSMIGVLLSLGMLVDEAIVVSENIHRHTLMGKRTYDACIDGAAEVIPVLFVAMLTTVIAFLPLAALSGGLGAFIKIIPLMVIILVVASFLESFVFLPSHYAILGERGRGHRFTFREKFWETITAKYKSLLLFLLRFRYLVVIGFVVLSLSLSFVLVKKLDFVLFPEFDAMSISITGKVKGNALLTSSQESKVLEETLLEVLHPDDVSSIHSTIGMKSNGRSQHEIGNHFFTIAINLKPKMTDDYFNRVINPIFHLFGKNIGEKRTRSKTAKEIVQELEKLLQLHRNREDIVDISAKIPQTGVVKDDVALLVTASSDKEAKKAIGEIKAAMHKIDGVFNIKDDMDYGDIDLVIDVNAYGKDLGFSQGTILSSLKKHLTLEEVSRVDNDEHELVKLKLKVLDKNSLSDFENLPLEVPNTKQIVRLKNISHMQMIRKISTIKKENMQRVFAVTAALEKSKVSSRKFYRKLKPTLNTLKKKGITVTIKGEAGKNKEIQRDIIKSLLFALLGILIVLTWFFNSFWLSLFSLTVIPLSVFGVLLGHLLLGLPLTFSTLMGFVGLVGVVMNDTLIMLGFIKQSKDTEEIPARASMRLRPILLTSITTILGLSTLMFFASGESLLMQPLAVSIGFGLLWATVINLFYVPLGFAWKKSNKLS